METENELLLELLTPREKKVGGSGRWKYIETHRAVFFGGEFLSGFAARHLAGGGEEESAFVLQQF